MVFCFICLSACKKGSSDRETTQPSSVLTVRVTVPEGYTVSQTAKLLEEKKVCAAKDFMAAVNSTSAGNLFAGDIKNKKERAFLLEGYVFPDTYDFYVNEPAQKALNRFLTNMKNKLTQKDYARAKVLGFSMDEILTLASLIQEESGAAAQMKTVSSVLHNRLDSSGFPRLQLDVTIRYIEDYVKPYIDGNKDRYSKLYNTYKCKGLPAGPICNPGRQAVEAALYPKKTEYYYFVAAKDGTYYYAKTYTEHLKHVKEANITMPD